jgi:hypothetical protein
MTQYKLRYTPQTLQHKILSLMPKTKGAPTLEGDLEGVKDPFLDHKGYFKLKKISTSLQILTTRIEEIRKQVVASNSDMLFSIFLSIISDARTKDRLKAILDQEIPQGKKVHKDFLACLEALSKAVQKIRLNIEAEITQWMIDALQKDLALSPSVNIKQLLESDFDGSDLLQLKCKWTFKQSRVSNPEMDMDSFIKALESDEKITQFKQLVDQQSSQFKKDLELAKKAVSTRQVAEDTQKFINGCLQKYTGTNIKQFEQLLKNLVIDLLKKDIQADLKKPEMKQFAQFFQNQFVPFGNTIDSKKLNTWLNTPENKSNSGYSAVKKISNLIILGVPAENIFTQIKTPTYQIQFTPVLPYSDTKLPSCLQEITDLIAIFGSKRPKTPEMKSETQTPLSECLTTHDQNTGKALIHLIASFATAFPPEFLELFSEVKDINVTTHNGGQDQKNILGYFFSETLFANPDDALKILRKFLEFKDLKITKKMINELVTSQRADGFNIISSLCLTGLQYGRPEIFDYFVLILHQITQPSKSHADEPTGGTQRLVKSASQFKIKVNIDGVTNQLELFLKTFLETSSEYSALAQQQFLGMLMSFKDVPFIQRFLASNKDKIVEVFDPSAFVALSPFSDTQNHMHYLNYLASQNDLSSLQKIAARCGDSFNDLANLGDRDGNKPVHIASEKGFDEILEFLISHNVELSTSNNKGETPLHKAAENGKLVTCQKLIVKNNVLVLLQDKVGNTPFMMLVKNSGSTSVEAFLELLPDQVGGVLRTNDFFGVYPLQYAALRGLKSALSKMKRFSPLYDQNGRSIAHYLVEAGHEDMLKEGGVSQAELEKVDKDGISPLVAAFQKEFYKTAELLALTYKVSIPENFLYFVLPLRNKLALETAIQILKNKMKPAELKVLLNTKFTIPRCQKTPLEYAKELKFEGATIELQKLSGIEAT